MMNVEMIEMVWKNERILVGSQAQAKRLLRAQGVKMSRVTKADGIWTVDASFQYKIEPEKNLDPDARRQF